MFRKILNLVKQSAVYGVGTIAARAVAFLMLPYYSHLLSTKEYGVYALFLVLVGIMQQVYLHGMDISFVRFSAAVKVDQQKRDLGTVLIQTLWVGGLFSLLMYFFAAPVAKVVVSTSGPTEIFVTQLCAIILLTDTLGFHFFTYLRIRNKPAMFSFFKMGNVILNIGLNVLFVGTFKMGVIGAFWAFLLASTVVLIGLMIVCRKDVVFAWKWLQVREWIAFGLPNLPSMFFIMAIEFSDRKWIEALMGVDEAGIYSAGYRIGMLMNMVAQAFRYAWQPFFMQTEKDDDAKATFARVLTYYMLFAGWVWVGSSLLLGYVLKMPLPGIGSLIHPSFWAGFGIFPIIMLAHIFNGIYANFMVGIYVQKKTKIIPLVVGVAAIVNIVGNGLLIPIYGYMASAWLTVLSYAIIAVGVYLYIAPRYKVPYEWGRIARIVVTSGMAYGIGMIFENDYAWIPRAVVLIALPALWYVYVLSAEEKEAISRKLGSTK